MWWLLLACTGSSPAPEGAGPAPQGGGSVPAARNARPDIVLVVIDTVRASHTSVHGYERDTTPHLAELARRGAWYSHAYAQAPWTLASFSTIFTGLYPFEHKVARDDEDATAFGHLDPATPTLAGTLEQAGYATAAFINNTFLAPEFGLNSGFDVYDYQGSLSDSHRSAEATVEAGLAWLDAQQGPAFLLLHFMEPHLSYRPPADVHGLFAKGDPPESIAKPRKPGINNEVLMQTGAYVPDDAGKAWMRAMYDEELYTADRALGKLVAALDAREAWDRTLLVVTADHGEEFWEHGVFEHGSDLFSEQTQVPLVVAGAGAPRGRVDVVVEHVDLFRTLLDVAGAAPPPGSHGEDLFALAGADPVKTRRTAFSENCLYGPPRLSLVDADTRFVMSLVDGYGEAWTVGPDGDEAERLQGEAQLAAGRRMVPLVRRLRGNFDPIDTSRATSVPSYEVFQQLSALGYLEDR